MCVFRQESSCKAPLRSPLKSNSKLNNTAEQASSSDSSEPSLITYLSKNTNCLNPDLLRSADYETVLEHERADKSTDESTSIISKTDQKKFRCETCEILFDTALRERRRLIDSCGHAICFTCLVENNECKACARTAKTSSMKSSSRINNENTKSPILTKKQNARDSRLSDDDDDFDAHLESLMTEIDMNSNSATKHANEREHSDPIQSISKQTSVAKNIENLFDYGEQLSKQFNSSISTNSTNGKSLTAESNKLARAESNKKSIVYIDSDDDDILIEEIDDEIISNRKPDGSSRSSIGQNSYYNKEDYSECPNEDDDEDDQEILELCTQIQEKYNNKQKQTSVENSSLNVNTANTIASGPQIFSRSCSSTGSRLVNGVSIPDIEQYEKIKWLFNDIKDCSPYYRSLDYPHTQNMINAFRNLFGLKQFRPQQFETINAALLQHNCFVLMPTGGGKSLCYQLPAVLSKGVTFVVSPLKSLIIDQVQKLNALNLSAAHLLSDMNGDTIADSDSVYADLTRNDPELKLVYVTPEKLNGSSKLTNIITALYRRNMMARLVIDEAHCVSTWGHDFRKDYTQMGQLRTRLFPNVPVMLLTATATPRVRKDILLQMSLSCEGQIADSSNQFLNNRRYINAVSDEKQKCAFFIQSFNRENLIYQVEWKSSNNAALEKIVELIKSKYANKSGIVYCISRNECESVSNYLRSKQIKSLAYHAGMNDKDRATIQHRWSNNLDCRVVCATIAFGMGIDKADVRFVIHFGLPKSLEGYYQESGRAGRDGQVSLCLLFFNNQDRHKWLRLMKQEFEQNKRAGNNSRDYEIYKVHTDNLYRMSQYCDNRMDCRRAQILEYFGEIFDRRKCIQSKMQTACDNCIALANNQYKIKDITADAATICRGVQRVSANEDFTLIHLSEILKGSMNSKIVEKGHNQLEMHAKLCKYKKNDIERIIRKLIFMGFLKEEVKIVAHMETVASYIKLGPKASELLNPRNGQFSCKIEFDLQDSKENKKLIYEQVVNADDEEDDENETENEGSNGNQTLKTPASSNKRTATKQAVNQSSPIKRIILRCKTDLKQLAKKICTEKGVKNVNSLFSSKMLTEMIAQMPTTREALLKVTYFTEAIYQNYKGEEFLKILQHYSNLIGDAKQEQEREAAAAVVKAKVQESTISLASRKNMQTYGLLDEDDLYDRESSYQKNIDYDASSISIGSSSSWLNSKATSTKKRTGSSFKSYGSSYKKSKTSLDESSVASSSYFNSQKGSFSSKSNFSKKKNWKAWNSKNGYKKKS
jgi:superfamily II DNA helicase RecQ